MQKYDQSIKDIYRMSEKHRKIETDKNQIKIKLGHVRQFKEHA